MITVEEALERILASVSILETETQELLACQGQVLAADIYSPLNVPPADNAAMDGFAVLAEDTKGASPASPRLLKVIGQVAAGGVPLQRVTPGTAVRIMTGAPVPSGANAVVQFEDTDEEERRSAHDVSLSHIAILREAEAGLNIRRLGEDVKRGNLVLSRGTELRPPEIGLLASLGVSRVPVVRRPVVAILGTGDELTPLGQPLTPGKIYDSNTYSLAALSQRLGTVPQVLGIAPDQAQALREKIQQGLEADLLLTSGGVSLGDYDIVKEVLAREGEMNFLTVRMKPGKPLAFGLFRSGKRRVPHLGLPGNPVSVMITFTLFARPALLKMMGKPPRPLPTLPAVMEDGVGNRDGRRTYARVRLRQEGGRYFAKLTGPQGSGILTSMAQAQGLAIIPEDCPGVKPGQEVQVMLLEWS